jgi:subtilase family serine protease
MIRLNRNFLFGRGFSPKEGFRKTTMRLMKASPLNVLAILAGILLCSTALLAQNSYVAPRITTDVNELSLATLRGNVPRLARAEFDQGEASASTQLTHVRLVLSRSSEQQAALDAYLAQLQDKSSPNYHKWLTPEQFGQLYGPADSDIAALVAWLESHGLQVETVSKGRTNIAFSGSVNQVEEAFHTSIHSYQAGDRQFTSNTTDPQIPSALAPLVMGVAHLNTIRPRPHSHRTSTGQFNPETRRLEPLNSTQNNAVRPGLTGGSGTSTLPYRLWIVPGDAATIYDTPNLYNANFAGGTSYDGSGVKIGIGGDATINASIVGTYRSTFLGSSTTPILNYCGDSSAPVSCVQTNSCAITCSSTPGSGYVADDADEAYLDTELSGGLAPGATIYYYASPDLNTGIEAAITANLVDIFSLSFGECEQDMSTSDNAGINLMWQQAAAQGIAVMVSAGDNGSAGCDVTSKKSGKNVPDAVGGLAVSGYASTPNNIAVGGTDFYSLWTSNAVFEQYVSTSNGIGLASSYYRTALSYIPESTWNDSTYYDTTISADVPLSEAGVGFTTSYNNIVAGSGGASVIYSKPSWQTGTGVPSDGARDLPDVALMSGNGFDSATWVVCDADTYYLAFDTTSSTAEGVLNCSNIAGGYFDGFGGTSTASPAFAGILALVQQKTGNRLGQAAKALYELYNGSYGSTCTGSSCIFHDVTVGNNSVPCTSGTPNCLLNTAGYYYESDYNTTTGYDLATGMGSVDVKNLVNYWSTANSSATATVGLTLTPSGSITTAQSLTVEVSVTGTSTIPTGNVTLSGGGYLSSVEALSTVGSAGVYTFTIPAGGLATGSDTLTAIYNGDAANSTYGIATGTATVTVTGSSSSATFSLSATTPSSIAPGGTAVSTVTVSSSNSYSGTVTLTCALTSYPSGAAYLPSCSNGSNTLTLSSGVVTGTGSATITVYTTAATSDLVYPKLPGKGRGWAGAGGGAVLAFLIFLGIPARRRSWRSMLVILIMMTALGSLAACGGSGGSGGGGGGGGGIAGTTAGTYTFTVTGLGSPIVNPAPTATFTVIVN